MATLQVQVISVDILTTRNNQDLTFLAADICSWHRCIDSRCEERNYAITFWIWIYTDVAKWPRIKLLIWLTVSKAKVFKLLWLTKPARSFMNFKWIQVNPILIKTIKWYKNQQIIPNEERRSGRKSEDLVLTTASLMIYCLFLKDNDTFNKL